MGLARVPHPCEHFRWDPWGLARGQVSPHLLIRPCDRFRPCSSVAWPTTATSCIPTVRLPHLSLPHPHSLSLPACLTLVIPTCLPVCLLLGPARNAATPLHSGSGLAAAAAPAAQHRGNMRLAGAGARGAVGAVQFLELFTWGATMRMVSILVPATSSTAKGPNASNCACSCVIALMAIAHAGRQVP
jgi:hypothetical protein